MRRFGEKLFIIIFCLYNTYKIYPEQNLALYFLISLIISSALDLIDNKKGKALLYIIFGLMSFLHNPFILYIPLILYNFYLDFGLYSLFYLPLISLNFSPLNLFISILSIYLAIMNKKHSQLLDGKREIRDQLREDTLYLQKYNEQLKKDREKNIQIAILSERNRIARKLHDSIGHAISSSILQLESLKIISAENKVIEKLETLQKTLSSGMDDIRKSIHNLYRESLDLERQIEKLSADVPDIKTELVYRLKDNLSYELKHDILSVVKEGITNCVKHSSASKLKISLLDQPEFYSIIIKDNGSEIDKKALNTGDGMGLVSIKEIADKYNGLLNYQFDKGFKIHLTLMKGQSI
ncbi:MAG TPA: histidine kinase [Halanaerobiales bacterium]|nr:histidine kinase [Halanaerobiales bacterium]